MSQPREILESLERVVWERKNAPSEKSYTSRLFSEGVPAIGAKVTEEAGELVEAAADESVERVVCEAADLLYHMLVLLAFRAVPLSRVEDELARRFGISGLTEKASRTDTAGIEQSARGKNDRSK